MTTVTACSATDSCHQWNVALLFIFNPFSLLEL
jgi:hypothetical protein